MDIPAFLARIAEYPQLSMPPGLALRVLERASRSNCAPSDMAELIRQDASLCGKLLRTVNSALYGLPQKVSSIDRALVLLGDKASRSLALSFSLPAVQRQARPTSQTRDYWKLSVAGAILARDIAVRMGRVSPEEDLVAGLLRDLGIPILQQMAPESYTKLLSKPPEVLAHRQCELEEETLGINHAEVAAIILSKWHLPAEITEAVRYHHHPEKAAGQTDLIRQRAGDLRFASLVAQLQVSPAQPRVMCEALWLAHEEYGMDQAELL